MPQQDSPHITDNFPQQAGHHTTEEAPCSSSNPEEDLSDQNYQKDDQVNRVAGNGGSVLDGLPGLGASGRASDATIFLGHSDCSLVVGVLKGIVDECGASSIPLGLHCIGDVVIVLAHGDRRRERVDEV